MIKEGDVEFSTFSNQWEAKASYTLTNKKQENPAANLI
jgi:hypothetical protein